MELAPREVRVYEHTHAIFDEYEARDLELSEFAVTLARVFAEQVADIEELIPGMFEDDS